MRSPTEILNDALRKLEAHTMKSTTVVKQIAPDAMLHYPCATCYTLRLMAYGAAASLALAIPATALITVALTR